MSIRCHRRLDGIASANTLIPLAAIYFFAAILILILTLKTPNILLLNAEHTVHWVVIALFTPIIGCLAARCAFNQKSAH